MKKLRAVFSHWIKNIQNNHAEAGGRLKSGIPACARHKEAVRACQQPRQPSALLYVDHVEQHGDRLFHLACRQDLEGIVAKLRKGVYDCQHGTSWIKIKNPGYTQIVGGQELFRANKTYLYHLIESGASQSVRVDPQPSITRNNCCRRRDSSATLGSCSTPHFSRCSR